MHLFFIMQNHVLGYEGKGGDVLERRKTKQEKSKKCKKSIPKSGKVFTIFEKDILMWLLHAWNACNMPRRHHIVGPWVITVYFINVSFRVELEYDDLLWAKLFTRNNMSNLICGSLADIKCSVYFWVLFLWLWSK